MPSYTDRLRNALIAARAIIFPPTKSTEESRADSPSQRVTSNDRQELAKQPSASVDLDVETPLQDKWSTIIGAKLTPVRVAAVLRQAEYGYMRAQCDLLYEMRETAGHLQAELGKREASVAGVAWSVLAANTKGMGRRAEKRAAEIRDFVELRLRSVRNLQKSLEHLASGTYYGRSAICTTFGRDSRGVKISSLDPIYSHRLSYASNWRIHLYDENGNDSNSRLSLFPGVDLRRDWPGRFIIHEPTTLGGMVPTRQGIGRVLVWLAMFLKWTDRDWLVFAEFFAKPWRIGFYSKSSDEKDIAHLKSSLLALSGYASAVFPEGTKPEFFWPQGVGNSRIHTDLHNAWLTEISKVINGATLQTSAGADGSRAQAEVHERTEFKLITKDGNALEETVDQDLIFWLVAKQYSEQDAHDYCPHFSLQTEQPEDQNRSFGRVIQFVDRGGEVDQDEVRDKYLGLSKPKPGASILLPASLAGAPDPISTSDANTTTNQPPDPTDPKEN